jgi:hypothetical protein
MDRDEGRTLARLAVQAEMAHRQWTNTELAKRSRLDLNTVGDFLSGARWPKSPTQGRIESAIGWPPGTLSAIAAGLAAPPVGGMGEDPEITENELLYRRPEGLSDAEWERIREDARGFIEWQIEKAARER